MITLLLTLFISVFSYCPSVNRLEDHYENTITPKYGFTYDGGDDEVTSFAYSFSDVMYQNAFLDFRNYFNTYTNYTVDDDDSIFPLGTVITLPIRYYHLGTFNNFDYAAGYPFGITNVADLNYIKLEKTSHPSTKTTLYTIGFTRYSDSGIRSGYNIRYRKTTDFDYVIGSTSFNGTTMADLSDFVFYGSSEEGSLLDLPFNEILVTIEDRTLNRDSYLTGWNSGYSEGQSQGYQTGYAEGYNSALQRDSTASTIFNGVLEIGLLPVNFFLSIFNFEVFGINIKGIVSGLLTVSVVIIILRFLFGGKDNDK